MASDALVARLARYGTLVEVGVGDRGDLAAALVAADRRVTATDVRDVAVPAGVRFVRDDVVERARTVATDPGPYAGADAVYARRLPPELHRPTLTVARAAGADCLFTTLGGDPPTVPVEVETLPDATLYRARADGPGARG
ncbi:MAG: UPF0146 family protein [Haloferacaceae archaeon]